MNRLRLTFAPLALLSLAHAQYPGSTPPPAELQKGFDSITIPKAKAILGFLAGPECQGRGSGQPGFQKAADFVAAKFKAAGLKPMGDNNTYFQNVPFYRSYVQDGLLETPNGRVGAADGLALNAGADKIDVSAPIVIVKASDGQATLSDSDAKALNGKIVLLVTPAGRSRIRSQVVTSDAKAVLQVADNVLAAPTVRRTQGTGGGFGSTVGGRISTKAVERLGGSQAYGFLHYKSLGSTASIYMLGNAAHITGKSVSEKVNVPNVVGLLEGTDPTLKWEFVGVGGHLDHLGVQNGVVFPGADDDGSGSTAVMLIADAMAHNPKKPRRSILFMTFCGEEMGLVGSGYLSDHPPVPLDRMVSELQMDMVARDSYGAQNGDPNRMDKAEENIDTIRLVGSKRISTELDKTIQEQNAHVGFRFKYDAEDVYTRSDHYNFAKHGIPIAFLFDGFTPDYHQPSDTVDKIDFAKLTNAAKLYYLTAEAIANRDTAPVKDVKS